MFAAVFGQRHIVTSRSARASDLVDCHRRANARAVNHDAAITLSAGDQTRHGVSDAGVIHRPLIVRPAILHDASFVPQKSQKLALQLEPTVIRADGNLQVLHSRTGDASPALASSDGQARMV